MSNQTTFKAFWIEEIAAKTFQRSIITRKIDDLPDHEVLVKVHYAGLNYKDALSANGHKGITRKFPHTPGVDAAGEVVTDSSQTFAAGTKVIVTSYDLGMNTHGGFAEYIRVPAAWVVPLPNGLTLREAMILGTGGFTAGLALYKMEQMGQTPDMGKVLVTGSTGGVGSHAVAILAQAGYEVIAVTGKPEKQDYLTSLGATEIISREDANDQSGRPLLRSRWAGAIDTIGDNTLATAIKACGRNGNVAVCGLVASHQLNTTVYPLILNGVNILGIETAETPMKIRLAVWDKLATHWKTKHLEDIYRPCTLEELGSRIDAMLQGKHYGRTVVRFV